MTAKIESATTQNQRQFSKGLGELRQNELFFLGLGFVAFRKQRS